MRCEIHDEPLTEQVLITERTRLVPMSMAVMQSVVAGDWSTVEELLGSAFPEEWREDGWAWLSGRIADGALDPGLLVWGTHLVRLVDHVGAGIGPVVAEAGFHGPPDADGWVEIGYRVVEARRREGFAREVVSALLRWASQRQVSGVRASVAPGNDPSLGLLRSLGFVETGAYRHQVLGDLLLLSWAVVPGGLTACPAAAP